MGRPPLLKAKQVLAAIERLILRLGYPPTVEEIRDELGVGSTRTVRRYLQLLEDDGLIDRWMGARGLKVLRPTKPTGQETVTVPLLGHAPAGALTPAQEDLEGYLRLPIEMLRPAGRRHFVVRVRGNSMNLARIGDQLIESGDLLLVRQEPDPESGAVVVALVDGEVTVKRLVRAPNHAILRPESTETHFQPIVVAEDFRVQGVVTHVFKRGSQILDREC